MDWVTRFFYTVGDKDLLVSGDIQKIEPRTSAEGLRELLIPRQGEIILPKFLGVYQVGGPAGNGSPEERMAFAATKGYGLSMLNGLLNMMQTVRGGETDSIHPQLICVSYADPWTYETVRDALGDQTRRIAIRPVDSLPVFADKDLSLIELAMDKLKDRRKGISQKEARSIINYELEALEAQKKDYGLTREEWGFIEMFRENRMQQSAILSTLSRLHKKEKRK